MLKHLSIFAALASLGIGPLYAQERQAVLQTVEVPGAQYDFVLTVPQEKGGTLPNPVCTFEVEGKGGASPQPVALYVVPKGRPIAIGEQMTNTRSGANPRWPSLVPNDTMGLP